MSNVPTVTVTTQDVRSLGGIILCVPNMSVPGSRSSQDEQEARPVADHVSKCSNGGAGEQHFKLDKLSLLGNRAQIKC